MADLLPLLVLAVIGVMAAALFDCVTTDDRLIRQFPKLIWIIIILILPGFGAVLWFAGGRSSGLAGAHIASGHPAGRGRLDARTAAIAATVESPRPRTLAPDDDPEFLAEIASRMAQMREANHESRSAAGSGGVAEASTSREEERLRRWEADLRQREERLRQRGEPPIES